MSDRSFPPTSTPAERLLDAILSSNVRAAAKRLVESPSDSDAAASAICALLREIGRTRGINLPSDDARRLLSHTKNLRALPSDAGADQIVTVLQMCGGLPKPCAAAAATALSLSCRKRRDNS